MKKYYILNNFNLTYGRGYTYSIQYHFVWCTAFRESILKGDIESELENIVLQIANELEFTVTELEIVPDHIHILVDCSPQHFIPTIIKILKGTTARKLFVKYPEMKQQISSKHLWSASYFVCTTSEKTEEQMNEYLEKQKKRA